jgi:hypothetical protein
MQIRYQNKLFYGVSIFVFLIFSIWFFILHAFPNYATDRSLEILAAVYGIMALFGGIIGMYVSSRWGGFSSLLGKALGFFSLGLLAQEFGQLSYSYYSIALGIDVPYPSIGDLGFFGSIPLYALGAYYLIKICLAWVGNNDGKERKRVNGLAFVVPVAMLAVTYLFLLRGYEPDMDNNAGTFLDFAYPLFQAGYVSLALVCFYYTKSLFNSVMHKNIVFLLIALIVQYFADFLFLFKVHRDLYVTGGVTDFTYLVAYFLMTIAIINMNSVFEQIKNGKVKAEGGAVN